MMMSDRAFRRLSAVVGICSLVLTPLLWAWVVMLLWNWFLPRATHAPMLSYLGAFGVVCIAEILTFKASAEDTHGLDGATLFRRVLSSWFQNTFAATLILALGGLVYVVTR